MQTIDYDDMLLYGKIYEAVMETMPGDLTAAKATLGQKTTTAIMEMLPDWADIRAEKKRRKEPHAG